MKKPEKYTILNYAIYVIVIAVFNLFFFMLGSLPHPASVWIAYGFIHFAFIMAIVTPFITEKGRDRVTFMQSTYAITMVYFVIELVIGLIFIFIALQGIRASLLVQVFIAAIYLVVLFVNMIANEHTSKSVKKKQQDLLYVRDACGQLQSVLDGTKNEEIRSTIKKAYDTISSSPIKSDTSVQNVESQIMDEIQRLGNLVLSGEESNKEEIIFISEKIIRLTNDRNRILKLYQ